MPAYRSVLYAASTFDHLRCFHQPYLQAFLDGGARVVALAGGEPVGIPEGVECIEAPFTRSFFSPRNLSASRLTARLMRDEHFDLVLTHTSLAAFFVRLGVRFAGKHDTRVVNTVHGYLFDDGTSALRRAVLLGAEKFVAGTTDLVVTMNNQDTVIATQHRLSAGEVVQVPGMGVDLSDCKPADKAEKLAARQRLGIAGDAFVLLYAAEFSARKNQHMLIDAMPQLPGRAVLALPGTGVLLEECRQRAAELGLAGVAPEHGDASAAAAAGTAEGTAHVLMPGYADDLKDWRAAADICVSAARYEGMPFHVIEAMACGLPVVASNIKGHEDLIVDGENGLLYPYDDTAAFCSCITHLMDDPELCESLGAAARTTAQTYERSRVSPVVLALYRGTAPSA